MSLNIPQVHGQETKQSNRHYRLTGMNPKKRQYGRLMNPLDLFRITDRKLLVV